MKRVFAVAFSISLGVLAAAPIHASKSKLKTHVPKSSSTVNIPVAGQWPQGPCDASDVITLIGKDGVLDLEKQQRTLNRRASAMLAARIKGCRALIRAALPSAPPRIVNLAGIPTPSAQPTPLVGCTGTPTDPDPVHEYAALLYCTNWIAKNIPSPSPTPAIAFRPPNCIGAAPGSCGFKAVYVFAMATDAPTAAQVTLQLTRTLQTAKYDPPADCKSLNKPDDCNQVFRSAGSDPWIPSQRDNWMLVAVPGWGLQQYQQQCASDSDTAGAIVVMPPGSANWTINTLFATSRTRVTAQTLVADCEPANSAYTSTASYITWAGTVHEGVGEHVSLSVSTILAALTGYSALHPTQSQTYVRTTPVPAPSPTLGPFIETQYTTNIVPGADLYAAAAVTALTQVSSANLGAQSSPDAQARAAMVSLAQDVVRELATSCAPSNRAQLTQCAWINTPPSPISVKIVFPKDCTGREPAFTRKC